MSTFEWENPGKQVRETGTLHAPGSTPGDVLTVNADKSVSPAPGGGSMAWGETTTAKFSGSGSPVGVVTPSEEGDLYVDTTTPALWQATGATSSDWQQLGVGSLTDAVVLDPADSTRNVVTPAANVRGLEVDASAGSDSEPPVLTIIKDTGDVYAFAASLGEWDTATSYYYVYRENASNRWFVGAVNPDGSSAQSFSDAFTVGADPSSNAYNVFYAITEPADALFANGGFALWLDPTPGATKLNIKAADSDGAIRKASIALAP